MAIALAHGHFAQSAPQQPALPPRAVAWTAVSEGLWSGTHDDEFVGSIEFTEGRFEAVDCTGRPLGRSHSLAGAKGLLEGSGCVSRRNVLTWRHDRRAITLTWAALAVSTIASIALAVLLIH